MNKNTKNVARTSNTKNNIKTPNYDANQSRIKINKIIEEKNAEKMRKKIKVVFTFILIGLLICGVYLVLKLPYFNIESIEAQGNKIYTNGDIVASLKSELGKNIFIERFFSDVKVDLPFVESTKIKMKLPNTIIAEVEERSSIYFAYDKENNVYYRLDKNGYILEKCSDVKEKSEDEELILGISFSNDAQLGTKIDDAYVQKLNSFFELKKKIDANFKDNTITKVNFENSLTTVTLDDKLNVEFNLSGDINYSISLLKAIIDKLPEGSAGIIDMTKSDPIFSSY